MAAAAAAAHHGHSGPAAPMAFHSLEDTPAFRLQVRPLAHTASIQSYSFCRAAAAADLLRTHPACRSTSLRARRDGSKTA